MKGKGATTLLIALVAVVWGLILYRVVKAYSSDEETGSAPVALLHPSVKEPANDYSNIVDTTQLLLNYRDPFSNTSNTSPSAAPPKDTLRSAAIRNAVVRPAKAIPSPNLPVAPVVNWNVITYTGYIRNPATKRLLALLRVNGTELMLGEGEAAGQVKLLRNLRDSIKVSYQGKTRFITLNTANPSNP